MNMEEVLIQAEIKRKIRALLKPMDDRNRRVLLCDLFVEYEILNAPRRYKARYTHPERILDALRRSPGMPLKLLALEAYNIEETSQLRSQLARLKKQGKVVSSSKGHWVVVEKSDVSVG